MNDFLRYTVKSSWTGETGVLLSQVGKGARYAGNRGPRSCWTVETNGAGCSHRVRDVITPRAVKSWVTVCHNRCQA